MNEEAPRYANRLDDLDRRLIAELQADPRIAYASLGSRLGVTGMTAANRLQRLRQLGLLKLRALPELDEFGLDIGIHGLAQVEVSALDAVVEVLARSNNVLRIDRITGEFDILFDAAFPSEASMGVLVRALQGIDGVRRLVIHHRIQTMKAEDGWKAVFSERGETAPAAYEMAPGTVVPRHLEPYIAPAARWMNALVGADLEQLRALSAPDIVFTILPPHPAAGTFAGYEALQKQSERTHRVNKAFWYRVVAVSEGKPPFGLVLDALSTVENHKGQVLTAFSRMAFAFDNGRLKRVMSLGEMDLPDVPIAGEEVSAGRSKA